MAGAKIPTFFTYFFVESASQTLRKKAHVGDTCTKRKRWRRLIP
jgi:hypothetical protein